MVDIDTHRVVDLIESRDKDAVVEWLKTYPNIQVVSRDGSLAYTVAINEAHPEAIQMSNRFHLFKNLSEAVEKYFFKLLPTNVEIPITKQSQVDKSILTKPRNRAERIRFARKKYAEGHTIAEIALMIHSTDQTIKKYLSMREEDIPESKLVVREREHLEAIEKKRQKVEAIRNLHKQGYSIDRICKFEACTYQTVKNYISPDYDLVNGQYGKRRGGPLYAYEKEVLTLLSQGLTYPKVAEIISKKGYTGSVAALRVFVSKARYQYDQYSEIETKEYVHRKWLIQLIYKGIKQVKGITEDQLAHIYMKYPIISKIYDNIKRFYEIVFSKK